MEDMRWGEVREALDGPLRRLVYVAYRGQHEFKRYQVHYEALSGIIALGRLMPGRFDERWPDRKVPGETQRKLFTAITTVRPFIGRDYDALERLYARLLKPA